jgi:hypothetical protein
MKIKNITPTENLNEISNELLSKYKTAAGKSASSADNKGDFKTGNKRFSGIVKATKKQFANDKKSDVKEARFDYDKKLGNMTLNQDDSDQRHGLYVNGKLVKTYSTKDEAENVKMRNPRYSSAIVKKIAEGGMGGINRCAPANDVSYQDILNDVTDKWKGSTVTVQETGPYANKLGQLLDELNEADFTSILKKQYDADQAALPKPKAKVVDIPFHGWVIRYRPSTDGKTPWIVLNKRGEEKNRGSALSDKEAVAAAEDWIKSGGGVISQATTKVNIDFNIKFINQMFPNGETFYAMFDADGNTPIIYVSDTYQPGFKTSHNKPGARTAVMSLSPNECNDAKLQPNGRYLLGDNVRIDENTTKYSLILQSITQSSSDKEHMPGPGITVAIGR